MEIKECMEFWFNFSDIPVDEHECIEDDFHILPRGTDRFEIWHWFDELSPDGIYKMLLNRIPKTNND